MTNSNVTYPYSDDLMIWDEKTKKYYITEKALLENGTDLRARLGDNDALSANKIIQRLLRHSTAMIYNFIHKHSTSNALQDRLIATCPQMRDVIFNALLNQAEYILLVGDLSRSVDIQRRALAIDETAKDILAQDIPGLGTSILYTGGL